MSEISSFGSFSPDQLAAFPLYASRWSWSSWEVVGQGLLFRTRLHPGNICVSHVKLTHCHREPDWTVVQNETLSNLPKTLHETGIQSKMRTWCILTRCGFHPGAGGFRLHTGRRVRIIDPGLGGMCCLFPHR